MATTNYKGESAKETPVRKGFLGTYLLDGEGGYKAVERKDLENWSPKSGIAWVHLDRSDADVKDWIRTKSGLEQVVIDAFLEEESRPRMFRAGEGLFINMRGMNLNPDEDVEDMISLRIWVERNRIITARRLPLMAVRDIGESLEQGQGPKNIPEFLAKATHRLTDKMEPVLLEMEEEIDALDEAIDWENHT